VIDGPQALDKETKLMGLSKDFKEGVLFCTYSSLTSNPKKARTHARMHACKENARMSSVMASSR
jgi:hypothetical protein